MTRLPRASGPVATMPPGRAGRVAAAWLLVSLVVYVGTCAPGVLWGDSGIHQYRILAGQLEHMEGLALSHPLHYWLGRFALWLPLPLGEPAYRVNLLSAVGGAVAVGLVAGAVASITRNGLAASIAAATVMLAHSFWQLSVEAEVLSISAAFMTAEWAVLLAYCRARRPWFLVALFAVNGLHVADHQFGLLTGAVYVILVVSLVWRRKLAWPWLIASAMAWIVADTPFWLMLLGHYRRHGNLLLTISSALFGGDELGKGWTSHVLNLRPSVSQLKLFALSLGYSFPSLAIPVAIAGMFHRLRRRERAFHRALLAQTVLLVLFVARYPVQDLYTFLVPVCAQVGFWNGLGVHRLLRWARNPASQQWLAATLCAHALLPLAVYSFVPILAERQQWLRSQIRALSYRNEYTYFFRPWRCGERSAAVFSCAALEYTGPAGWLLGDTSTAWTAAYTYQQQGGPGGIRIYSECTCINVPGWPRLSPNELRVFLRAGGRVVVVPSAKADALWGTHFPLDKSDARFWRIPAGGAGQTALDRVNSEELGEGGP